jgi:uncharacterized protein (TIGR02145 family)
MLVTREVISFLSENKRCVDIKNEEMTSIENISFDQRSKIFLLSFLFISLFLKCEKIEPEKTVKVATGSVTDVTGISCSIQGAIIDMGDVGIDQHGFCWALTQNPTTADNKMTLGSKSSTGNFSGDITGLSPNTTYYIRAYASNKHGDYYGEQKSFSTLTIELPVITTTPISNLTGYSAQTGGNVTDNGGSTIIQRGVCYAKSIDPNVTNSSTTDEGQGTGSFISNLTDLEPGTTYYVRAYATNSIGTNYGDNVTFTTLALPSITTVIISNLKHNSAESGGNVTDEGDSLVTEYGVCWSTSENPTISDYKTVDGSGSGSFTSQLTGLTENTTYYVRAYAVSNVGTAYGDQVSFTTLESVTDYDGNIYPIITIGTQTWMAENLHVTHYNNGDPIPKTVIKMVWSNTTSGAYCYFDNDSALYANPYGAMYNWYAVNDSRNVCPSGWHVPTVADWTTLSISLGGAEFAGGKMKEAGTTHWMAPNTGASNESGFSGLPGGYRNANGDFANVFYYGTYWSSTELNFDLATHHTLHYSNTVLFEDNHDKNYGHSVRCVKD